MLAESPTLAWHWFEHNKFIRWLSVRCIFFGMLFSATFNQQENFPLLLGVGRVSFWFTLMAMVVLVWSTFRNKLWIVITIFAFLVSKAGRIAFGANSLFLLPYICFSGILFCAAGAAVAFTERKLIYRQVMLFCLLSIPLMVLQLAGVGEWTQVLRTDSHNLSYGLRQFPTLFVSSADVVITTLQARPSGFCWSNNFLSIVIAFALGLHFGRLKSASLAWNDLVLCTISTLAMAKIVFLIFAVITAVLLICGESWKRRRMAKVTALLLLCLGAHSFFFPGVFAYTTSWELLQRNFQGRLSDLARSSVDKGDARATVVEGTLPKSHSSSKMEETRGPGLSEPSDLALAAPDQRPLNDLAGVPHLGIESGYAKIANALPYLGIVVFLILPFFLDGFKKLEEHFPHLKDSTLLSLLVLLLLPLSTTFLEGAFFWFIAGFALLPLFLIKSHYLELSQRNDYERGDI